jgi:hypothetical protein
MHDQIDTALQRALKNRARPGIVGDRDRARGSGRSGQARQILGLEHHAGRAL